MTRSAMIGAGVLGALAIAVAVVFARVTRSPGEVAKSAPVASASGAENAGEGRRARAEQINDETASGPTPSTATTANSASLQRVMNEAGSPGTIARVQGASSTSTRTGASPSDPGAAFGTTAQGSTMTAQPDEPGSTPRTWRLRPEDMKVTVGNGTVDIATRDAFHTGALLPVLFVAGRAYRSSVYRAPNEIRFTDVGPVAPNDEIAIAYGDAPPIVLRKRGSR